VSLARQIFTVLAPLFLLLAAGCATPGGENDPRDPLEPVNRAIYSFNEGVDNVIARPVATAYRDLLPELVRSWVRNFFGNIADIFIGFNNVIQGKPDEGFQDWVRFAFNSTLGFFGINDVASDMGLDKHNEDFGQTFGRWGAGEGPYLVLPILGSSSVRDGAGTVVDIYADPVGDIRPIHTRNSAVLLRLVNTRADLLDASRILEQAALDKYVFQRDAYLQRRRSLVHDGSPPRDPADRPEREEKAAPPEKRGDAAPVNPANGQSVELAGTHNTYLPRLPANYEAVLATSQAPDARR
jgi:phospholipid-binding lipoprotein MlaA